jgi:hypothetical protein
MKVLRGCIFVVFLLYGFFLYVTCRFINSDYHLIRMIFPTQLLRINKGLLCCLFMLTGCKLCNGMLHYSDINGIPHKEVRNQVCSVILASISSLLINY